MTSPSFINQQYRLTARPVDLQKLENSPDALLMLFFLRVKISARLFYQ
jgi:hypothetical protein